MLAYTSEDLLTELTEHLSDLLTDHKSNWPIYTEHSTYPSTHSTRHLHILLAHLHSRSLTTSHYLLVLSTNPLPLDTIMSDRLTQLQVCLDQLVEQFNATVNYVNSNAEPEMLDEDPMLVSNIAASAPLPGQQKEEGEREAVKLRLEPSPEFASTVNELSTDIILKSRQIGMLIDLLPGIGVSPELQLRIIDELSRELQEVERERSAKILEKDALLEVCESLVVEVAGGMAETR